MHTPRCFKKITKVVLAVGAVYGMSQVLPYAPIVGAIVAVAGAGVAAYTDTIKKEKK